MDKKRCLLIVDLQNDFCPGGSLSVPAGDEIIAPINRLMEKFDCVAASRDMHPSDSRHFDAWPRHCVQGTPGADFHPDLNLAAIDCFLEKGTSLEDDGYSDFESTNLDLNAWLREQAVDELYVCGLATEYCVKETVCDAVRLGLSVIVLEDCIRAVDLQPGDGQRALQAMRACGAAVTASDSLEF